MRKTVNPNTIQANPDNPRTITEDKLNLLVKSLKEFPEMLEKRPIVVTTNEDGTFMALGGNMRARAAQQAGIESIEIDTADDWGEDKRKQFIIKDNASFGEWDWDELANTWDAEDLVDWGLDLPEIESVKIPSDSEGLDEAFITSINVIRNVLAKDIKENEPIETPDAFLKAEAIILQILRADERIAN